MQYGSFKIRPCDAAGAVAVLVPAKGGENVSLNKCVDTEVLLDGLEPLCLSDGPKTSLGMAALAQKALKDSLRPKPERIPVVAELLADAAGVKPIVDLLGKSQILLVHRALDLAALDIEQVLSPVELSGAVQSVVANM
mmetsp:Transcript_33484/g.101184  ORF Transcript_33484/g.101184 Transcript_33484/m.101184 type:complete len:138 (-) Transcript_33484:283-696(-)